jgi:hypothetical protein
MNTRLRRRWARLTAAAAAPAILAAAVLSSAAASASTQAPTRATAHAAALPAYCATGGAPLWSNLATCGWPGPTNTGPDPAACPNGLASVGTTPTQTVTLKTAGAVISCENITGMVTIAAANVTIANSTITASSGKLGMAANGTAGITVADGASATLTNTTVNGTDGVHACVWDQGTALTVTGMNCYGADDGIFSWADPTYSQTTGSNFTITGSYFHDLTTATSNGHEDGYQTEGAANGLIQHNTYQLTPAADAAIAIWDSRRSATSITITGNLITGGGFAAYAEDYNPGTGAPGTTTAAAGYTVTAITFTANTFSTYASPCVGKYGVWFTRPTWTPYQGGPTDGWNRTGNTVLETGEHIDSANPHQNKTLCQ